MSETLKVRTWPRLAGYVGWGLLTVSVSKGLALAYPEWAWVSGYYCGALAFTGMYVVDRLTVTVRAAAPSAME